MFQRLSLVLAAACCSAALLHAQAPSGATGQCKDGSYSTAASKSGACRGHQGVQTWYAAGPTAAPPAKTAPAARPAASPAAASTAASSGPAPSGSTGQCKDGTYSSALSKDGACRGHQGVKTWFSASVPTPSKSAPSASPAAMPAPAKPQSAPAAATSKSAPVPAPARTQPAPGGGNGQVWVNTETKVYHCSGDRYYGKTKQGAYMTEADARAKGARPDAGKPCSN
jgi:hypothetical protein